MINVAKIIIILIVCGLIGYLIYLGHFVLGFVLILVLLLVISSLFTTEETKPDDSECHCWRKL